ncbi:hypothetical protein VTN00DRAFT_5013 [Thermoascus crustaceus]|uniref:uncharacterized protein n=1 Tax=Thermoascus crustaceus TaxID=5088 RepID=UPI003743911B
MSVCKEPHFEIEILLPALLGTEGDLQTKKAWAVKWRRRREPPRMMTRQRDGSWRRGGLEITDKAVRAYRYGAGGVWGQDTRTGAAACHGPYRTRYAGDQTQIPADGRRGRPAGANGVRVAEAEPAMAPSHPRPSTDLSGTAASRQVRYGCTACTCSNYSVGTHNSLSLLKENHPDGTILGHACPAAGDRSPGKADDQLQGDICGDLEAAVWRQIVMQYSAAADCCMRSTSLRRIAGGRPLVVCSADRIWGRRTDSNFPSFLRLDGSRHTAYAVGTAVPGSQATA